jgi:hypothetical protein
VTDDPYQAEAGRLRSLVQEQLRAGIEPCLLPYEQLLLLGWYERELARLGAEARALAGTVDRNYAARLEAERASMAAIDALDLTPAARPGWNERTATPLDDSEG